MAYQAIVNGARGLSFFGGHLTQVSAPGDAAGGLELDVLGARAPAAARGLTSDSVAPALVAPTRGGGSKRAAKDVELVTREADGFLYVIAVRRGSASRVRLQRTTGQAHGRRGPFEYNDRGVQDGGRRQRRLSRLVPGGATHASTASSCGTGAYPFRVSQRARR